MSRVDGVGVAAKPIYYAAPRRLQPVAASTFTTILALTLTRDPKAAVKSQCSTPSRLSCIAKADYRGYSMGMKTIVIPKLEFLVLNKNTYVGSYRLHGVEGDDALLSLIRAFSAPG